MGLAAAAAVIIISILLHKILISNSQLWITVAYWHKNLDYQTMEVDSRCLTERTELHSSLMRCIQLMLTEISLCPNTTSVSLPNTTDIFFFFHECIMRCGLL